MTVMVKAMLAYTDPVKPEDVDIPPSGVYLSIKYDGIRAWNKEKATVSRTLTAIPNRHVQATLAHEDLQGLDGELIVGDPAHPNCYHITESAVMSRDGTPDFNYYVFDIWDIPHLPYRTRLRRLRRRVEALRAAGFPVVLVEQHHCRTNAELVAKMEAIYEAGHEGGIARRCNSPYKYNRSTLNEGYLLKIKEHVDSELQITGLHEMKRNTNEATTDARGFTKRSSHKANKVAAGTLGYITGIDVHSGEPTKIGTGKMKASEKQEVWNNREQYLGRICKYRYAAHGILKKPRHPRWIGWRSEIDMGEPK